MWKGISLAERGARIKAQWGRMAPGHKEQFRERVSEAAVFRYQTMTLQERRTLTEKARAKRWAGRNVTEAERRKRKSEYMRRYRGLV